MTNSEAAANSTTTGTEELISADADKFISNRGTEFIVDVHPNGLFFIKMLRGGVAPDICQGMYTSRSLAEQALTVYIQSKAKPTGVANVPVKRTKNAQSENQ